MNLLNRVADWIGDNLGWTLAALLVVLVGLMAVAVVAAKREEREWQAFAVTHECRVVEHEKGQTRTGTGIGFDGKGNPIVVTTSSRDRDRTTYLCNDGVRYTR